MSRISKTILITAAAAAAVYFTVAASEKGTAKTEAKTTVSETTVFSKCDHSRVLCYPLPENCTGLAPDEAAQKLHGRLINFEDGILAIEKTDPSLCEHHYRLYLDGNTIKAENLRTGSQKAEFPTAPSQFSQKDLELLKKGITADSDAELSSLIEDYTG